MTNQRPERLDVAVEILREIVALDSAGKLRRLSREMRARIDSVVNVRVGRTPVDRQRIGELLALGWSCTAIAAELGCSDRTVRKARTEIEQERGE